MQLEKEKAGERPSPGGDWLGVTRGRLKGVVLVEGRGEGRIHRDLDFSLYARAPGGDAGACARVRTRVYVCVRVHVTRVCAYVREHVREHVRTR